MNIQRAVKRSQWQEGDRSPIRHMGSASTLFLFPTRAKGFRNHPGACLTSVSGAGPRFKRPSTSGYSVRVDLQSGLPPSPATCNTFFRRLSLHSMHAMQGSFPPKWIIILPPEELSVSSKQYTRQNRTRGIADRQGRTSSHGGVPGNGIRSAREELLLELAKDEGEMFLHRNFRGVGVSFLDGVEDLPVVVQDR